VERPTHCEEDVGKTTVENEYDEKKPSVRIDRNL
jgi:hypothetical protein